MYNSIEQEFKKISYYRKAKKFITIVAVIVIILYLFSSSLINNIILQILVTLGIYLLIVISFYAFICFNIKKHKNIKINKWYKIKNNIILYKQFVHDEDIINLGAIYEKHKVNTSDKLSEALRHYQTLTARNIKKSGGLVAFLSLIISLVALFSTDIIQNNLENIIHTTTAILVALILYWGFNSIINYMNLMFGREQLYTRIENITSEIYMEKLVG